jgi:Tol biopolymer transport system component
MNLCRSIATVVFLCLVLWIPAGASATLQPQEPESDSSERKKEDSNGLPLKPVRQMEFETEEGTWISLDVSPDGQTIVFELMGDLYTIPIEGGDAVRITEGMAFDSQPAFSPDGKWIAFVSDRDGGENLWICRPDGTEARQITKGKRNEFVSPAWNPDSQYVLASKGGRTQDIWMYHIEGGSGVNVTGARASQREDGGDATPSRKLRMGAAMSPDGRFLYYSEKDRASVYNQMSFNWEIYRRDMVTGDADRITRAEFGAIRPAISPDGRFLAYATRLDAETGLRLRNLESGQDRWLRLPVQRDDMESRGTRDLFPGYAFTPDGKELVVTWDGKIWRVEIETGQETQIPFRARIQKDLGPLLNFQRRVDEGPVRSRLIQDPSESPDGKRLAYSAMAMVYVQDLPEGEPRRLTASEEPEFKPAWSPDGASIAYVTWNELGEGHIWLAASDGGQPPRRLTTTPAFYTDPVFSPDGSRIVARRGSAWMRSQTPSEFGGLRISLDLIWIPVEGGDARLIVPARGLGSPHFGPDEGRIFLYSRDGLISLRFDGTDRRTHLKVTGRQRPGATQPPPAQEVLIRPDGKWAMAKVDNQLYVISVPPVGGDGATVNVFSPQAPVQQLTSFGADSFRWSSDGASMTWAVGATYFRRPFESVSFRPPENEAQPDREEPEEEGGEAAEAGASEEPTEAAADSEKEKKPKEDHEAVERFEAELVFPRRTPEGVVVLRGATVITMNGDEIVEDADVVIENNRIRSIGPQGSTEISAQAEIVDVSGKFIVPGFVDTHAHYELRTEGVLELHNWSMLANLAYGVTTGLDVQTSTNDYLTYQDLVEAGRMIGPRAYSTGPGVFSNTDFQSAEEAKWVLERYKKHYRNHNIKAYVVGNRQQRQWVVQAANDLELTVTTEGALDLKLNMTHAIDGFGGNEHSLPIVPLFKDVVELFARSKTAYTPTLLVLYGGPWAENYFYQTTEVHSDPKLNRFVPHNELDRLSRRRPWFLFEEHAFPKTAEQAAKIQRAGGYIGVGGHGQLQGLGFHWEMWALAMGGMTPQEALRAATIDGATIIGLQQDLGSVEPGKLADLVVLEKNPLEDIRNTNSVRMVMKNGELFDGDTLTKIWPDREDIRPFWWWEGPTGRFLRNSTER